MPTSNNNNNIVVRFFSTLLATLRLESMVYEVAEDLRVMRRNMEPKQLFLLLQEAGLKASQQPSILIVAGLCIHARQGQETIAVSLFKHAVENNITALQAKSATELATKNNVVDFRKLATLIINGEREARPVATWDEKTVRFAANVKKSGVILSDEALRALEAVVVAQQEMRSLAHVYA